MRQVHIMLLALVLICPFKSAISCYKKPSGSYVDIIASYEHDQQFIDSNLKKFTLGSCDKFDGHFLVISHSPILTNLSFLPISYPNGDLPDNLCEIQNGPFKIKSLEETNFRSFFKDQAQILKECLQVEVKDSRGEIDYPQEQDECLISRKDTSTVVIKGPKCILKIRSKSKFDLKFSLDPLCTKKDFVASTSFLYPMDIKGLIDVKMAQNLTPGGADYEVLSNIDTRISFLPDQTLMPVSNYFGKSDSKWPTTYGAHVEIGKISLNKPRRPGKQNYTIRVPLLINNNCPQTCNQEICSSPCNFHAPVTAYMILRKKRASGRYGAVAWWYQGNFVPSKFLGQISLANVVSHDTLNIGDQFVLEAKFSAPAISYKILRDQANQAIIKINNIQINGVGGTSGMKYLPRIEALSNKLQLPRMITMPSIKEMASADISESFDFISKYLNKMTKRGKNWPPYYATVCHDEVCAKSKKTYLTYKVGFTVKGFRRKTNAVLENVIVQKRSLVFGSYTKRMNSWPTIKCN